MAKKRLKSLDPDTVVPWLASTFKAHGQPGLIAGVGEDDCGVIQIGNSVLVVSADFLNATPIAEQLNLGGERVLGRIAVAATLADLLGTGARPRGMVVAATIPHGFAQARFKELMLGVQYECRRWRVPVISGDTKLGAARALLTCGFGTASSKRQLFLANRARPDDVLFTSGNLGTCATAAFVLGLVKTAPRWARRAITTPQLPVTRSRNLSELQIANAGIDVSDGLAADLRRMCAASDVGAVLEVDRIPIDPHVTEVAKREHVSPWAFALASGGDFQFLVTVPRTAANAAEKLGFTRIGFVTRERSLWIANNNGDRRQLPLLGHKDRKGQRFVDEIRRIIRQVARG